MPCMRGTSSPGRGKKILSALQCQTPFIHCSNLVSVLIALAAITSLVLDLKRKKQKLWPVLCHTSYSQDDEGPQVKIIKRKLEVSYFRSEPIYADDS